MTAPHPHKEGEGQSVGASPEGRALPSDRAFVPSATSPQAVSPVPASIPSAVERIQELIAECEHRVAGTTIGNLLALVAEETQDDPRTCVEWALKGAFLEAAIALLPEPAVWRKYTDDSAAVYGASPYNAAAQERFDGYSPITPLAIAAAYLRMVLAPLLKAQAIEARARGEAQ